MDDGLDVECRIKGNFRIRGIRSTNPVAVGDFVSVDGEWITDVEERKNYIIRRSTNLSKESHILAANIDQVALIVTINHPVTSTTFIDRFLATCEAYRVPAILIFNKIDLLTEEELAQLADLRALYESIGYETLSISAKNLNSETINAAFEGAKSAVPPLVRPLLTERASGSSNKLRRGNGRIRPALLGNPFRGLLRGVFSQRSLPLSPAGGSLRRGDCDTFPHRRNSAVYDTIPLGACQPPYRATSRIRESKIKIPDSSIKLRLLCLLTE